MNNDILQGDVITRLRDLPAESVHTCITSPPYWGLRDYGLPPTDWPSVTFTPAAGLPELTIPAMSCCLGLEPEPWAFVGHLVLVFREVGRVLRGDGTVWCNLGDSYASSGLSGPISNKSTMQDGKGINPKHKDLYFGRAPTPSGLKPKDLCGLPWMVAKALQADGWWLRSDIIFAKPNPMPESVTDRPTKAHEYLFLLAKSQRYFYDNEAVREGISETTLERWNGIPKRISGGGSYPGRGDYDGSNGEKTMGANPAGRNRRTVWTIATQPYAGAHFATFPPALVEPCILAGTSARGVCPACGAPWARVVEREFSGNYNDKEGAAQSLRCAGVISGGTEKVTLGRTGQIKSTTTGWLPTCACDAGDPVPATVLDPFFGSGTTGYVAVETGRRYKGIELNPEYVKLAEKRLAGAQPALIPKGLE